MSAPHVGNPVGPRRRDARVRGCIVALAVAAAFATLAGCASVDGRSTDSDDPMRVGGSATAGATVGSPGGPYSPRR